MNIRSAALHHLVSVRRPPTRRIGKMIVRPARRTLPATTYVICTNPRSGSWLLSDALASTGLAGNPREWFNIQEEQQHRAQWRLEHPTDLSYATYLDLAATESQTRNGIAGIKLHYYQLLDLPKKMEAIGGFGRLTADQLMGRLFPQAKYLWLTRRDKVRQAVSFLIASTTGEWWAIDGVTADKREGSTAEPEFDPHAIARMEQVFAANDAKWRKFFNDGDIAPCVVHYEDLVSDYSGTIARVLKWLGVPNADAVSVPPSRLKRQSDERSEQWLKRYAAFKKRRGRQTRALAEHEHDDPLHERAQNILNTVPIAWKQWIVQSKAHNANDESIVEILTRNGYSRAAALAEVGKVAADRYLVGAVQIQRRLNKAVSLLNVQGQLSRLNSQANAIERRANLSRSEFRDRYYAANRPVIIRGLMTNWRAMTAWSPDYFKRIAGDWTVEVMTERDADPKYEVNGRQHRTQLRFADYIDMVYSGKITNDYYMTANNKFLQRPEARPLLADFTAFPEYLHPVGDGRQCFMWIAPAGTVTRLRHEASNILMAQVVGRKRYRLVPASQWQCVYNTSGFFSDVDCERPDYNRHPKFRGATVIDVVLQPGEVLFMPVGWWHHDRAMDVSMTLSFTNFVFPNRFTWE